MIDTLHFGGPPTATPEFSRLERLLFNNLEVGSGSSTAGDPYKSNGQLQRQAASGRGIYRFSEPTAGPPTNTCRSDFEASRLLPPQTCPW